MMTTLILLPYSIDPLDWDLQSSNSSPMLSSSKIDRKSYEGQVNLARVPYDMIIKCTLLLLHFPKHSTQCLLRPHSCSLTQDEAEPHYWLPSGTPCLTTSELLLFSWRVAKFKALSLCDAIFWTCTMLLDFASTSHNRSISLAHGQMQGCYDGFPPGSAPASSNLATSTKYHRMCGPNLRIYVFYYMNYFEERTRQMCWFNFSFPMVYGNHDIKVINIACVSTK